MFRKSVFENIGSKKVFRNSFRFFSSKLVCWKKYVFLRKSLFENCVSSLSLKKCFEKNFEKSCFETVFRNRYFETNLSKLAATLFETVFRHQISPQQKLPIFECFFFETSATASRNQRAASTPQETSGVPAVPGAPW